MAHPSSGSPVGSRDPDPDLPDDPVGALARRSRAAVLIRFVVFGVLVGSWLSRLADVKATLGLADPQWGALASSGSIGSLVAILTSAFLITRLGARRMSRAAVPLILLFGPLMASSVSPLMLGVTMVCWGLSAGLLQAPINSAAVAVEHAYGRPIMSGFHAGWSVGALIGGLVGALAAQSGLAPGTQIALTSLALAVPVLATDRWLPQDEPAPPRARARAVLSPQLMLLALIAFCSALAEGTASGWSSIYVGETLGAGSAMGALAYACFAAAMAIGRTLGDRVVQRLGRRRFLQRVPLLAVAGMAAGLAVGTPLAALLGFLLVGIGLSCATPTAFGAAGNQPGIPTGQGVATISIAAWPAFLAGPPLVGLLSSFGSLRVGLAVIVLGALLVSAVAGLLREEPGARAG